MRKISYAEIINSAKVMLSGLKLNTERVGKRGITGEFISNLESSQKMVMNLDNEQEDLKAKLKIKTKSLDIMINELNKMLSEAKKVVKLEMEQPAWKSFGIEDKR